ncbi:RNA polymerase sigma factor [Adhaeribacter terreus]|uniref:RNA polymerase sigma factor n=1 Tax=Adhaeribacter terreus TaxID=529703 RepID=A0ABW0EGN7_9BACT
MLTEQEIIEGCKKGKPACQEALYRLYGKRMKGICLRYSKTDFEADDIFQDAFVSVFKNIHTYRDGAFGSWIRRIFVNAAINNYRRNVKHYNHQDSHELEVSDETQTNGLDELSAQELMALINELPEGYKVVFNLNVVEGYSHAEIADMLGIAEATSRSQLARAKTMLKKKLEKINSCKYAS